jgi:hypothetical protein
MDAAMNNPVDFLSADAIVGRSALASSPEQQTRAAATTPWIMEISGSVQREIRETLDVGAYVLGTTERATHFLILDEGQDAEVEVSLVAAGVEAKLLSGSVRINESLIAVGASVTAVDMTLEFAGAKAHFFSPAATLAANNAELVKQEETKKHRIAIYSLLGALALIGAAIGLWWWLGVMAKPRASLSPESMSERTAPVVVSAEPIGIGRATVLKSELARMGVVGAGVDRRGKETFFTGLVDNAEVEKEIATWLLKREPTARLDLRSVTDVFSHTNLIARAKEVSPRLSFQESGVMVMQVAEREVLRAIEIAKTCLRDIGPISAVHVSFAERDNLSAANRIVRVERDEQGAPVSRDTYFPPLDTYFRDKNRLVSIAKSSAGWYAVTAAGARVFQGSTLPDGSLVASIRDDAVVVQINGRTARVTVR